MIDRPIELKIWTQLGRVLVGVPLSASELGATSPLMKLVYGVCGKDAIADAVIGSALGGFAFCRKTGSDAWRAELGLTAK